MTSNPPTIWDCLLRAGVPREHCAAASLAVVEFLSAHTEDMRAETERLHEATERRCGCGCPTGNGAA